MKKLFKKFAAIGMAAMMTLISDQESHRSAVAFLG